MSIFTEDFIQIVIVVFALLVVAKMYMSHEYRKAQMEEEEKTKRQETWARSNQICAEAEAYALNAPEPTQGGLGGLDLNNIDVDQVMKFIDSPTGKFLLSKFGKKNNEVSK